MKIGGISSITVGTEAVHAASVSADSTKFSDLISSMGNNVSSSQILPEGRLNGDYRSSFSGTYTAEADRHARPQGAAANSAVRGAQQKPIDRTSKLYEKAIELESYFVKQMLSSMRKTIQKSQDSGYAKSMYEDMLYDEYATNMTKTAGFGLADLIYNQFA